MLKFQADDRNHLFMKRTPLTDIERLSSVEIVSCSRMRSHHWHRIKELNKELGTRHRASQRITENLMRKFVIVSETGVISVAQNGKPEFLGENWKTFAEYVFGKKTLRIKDVLGRMSRVSWKEDESWKSNRFNVILSGSSNRAWAHYWAAWIHQHGTGNPPTSVPLQTKHHDRKRTGYCWKNLSR